MKLSEIGLYDSGNDVILLQKALNEKLRLNLILDGIIGKITQSAIQAYQDLAKIKEENQFGVYCGSLMSDLLSPFITRKYLQPIDIISAASELDTDRATIMTLLEVEACSFGFLNNGFPRILFERDKFYKYVIRLTCEDRALKYSAMNPDICNIEPGGYLGGNEELNRFNTAVSLNKRAAILATSWGLFQLNGFDYEACGYNILEEFINDMKESESKQLKAFVAFVKNDKGLWAAIKTKDWFTIAEWFHGPNYYRNNYDQKLRIAFSKYDKMFS
jgi:hypothetical protein